jgi:hypothetical protein
MEQLESALARLHSGLVDFSDSVKPSPVKSRDVRFGSLPALPASSVRSLIELSHAAQDACRDLANTQAFVRNRQRKLEDAIDKLRSLVCPGVGEDGAGSGEENGGGCRGGSPTLQRCERSF